LQFARGRFLEKRAKSLGKMTFGRDFARGGIPDKSAHRKQFVRGYTPRKKHGVISQSNCNV